MSTIGWSGFGRTAERMSKWLMRRRRWRREAAHFARAATRFHGPTIGRGALRVAGMQRTDAAARLGRSAMRRASLGHGQTAPRPLPLPRLADARGPGLGRRPLPRRPRQRIAAPRAIVVASAHFTAAPMHVGAAALPRTMHDFGGFPAGAVPIALSGTGPARARAGHRADASTPPASRPTSHPNTASTMASGCRCGACIPEADIPVVPLSVDPRGDARGAHRARPRAGADLRDDGVLVIGSGGFVHNLGDLDWQQPGCAARTLGRGLRRLDARTPAARTTSTPCSTGKRARRMRSARIRPSNT